MRRLLITVGLGLALLLAPSLAWAQQGTIAGTVIDEATGNNLPGANVRVQGTDLGSATGPNGQFSISGVPAGEQTVRVTFVGYEPTERTVNVQDGGTTRLRVRLAPDARALGEVVVTGLAQEQTRAEASVSVSSIDAGELTDNADFQSVQELFQGNVPGVTVSQSSGNIGAGIRFNVRGGVSLNSDGQPVIYIDGTRVNQAPTEGFGAGGQEVSPLADLNPDDIESIEVLKGPSASALYGTDGADGVVLIETKSGQQGQDLEVNYSGTLGYQEKVRDYPSSKLKSAELTNNLFRQGGIQEHQVSATGAFGDVNYYTSYSYRDSEGIIPNNQGSRNNFRANFEVNPNDQVRLSANTGFTVNRLTRPQNDNNLFGILSNGILAFNGEPFFFTDSTSVFGISDVFRNQRLTGSLSASYTPASFTGLQITAEAGADVSSSRENNTFPVSGTYVGITNGERALFEERTRQYNGSINARYNYQIASDFSATSTVGTQVFTRSTENLFLSSQNFGSNAIQDAGAGADIQSVGEDIFNRRSAGVFVRQSFTYQDTYSLSASVRRDYSTQVTPGPGNDAFTAYYPSVQGNIRFEQFDAVPDFFSQLKLRGAFGQSGALPSPLDIQELRLSGSPSGYGAGAVIGGVGNPNLEAETITEYEGGVDLEVNNRYSLSATYYFQGTNESIVGFAPAPSTGLGSGSRPRNVGRITGQGVETSLDLTLLQTERFGLDFSVNHTWQTSEVKDLDGQTLTGVFDRNIIKEGLPPRAFFGLEVAGAQFDENGLYDGIQVRDQNDDGVINSEDDVKIGEARPDHFGGFSLRARLFDHLTISGRAEYQTGLSVYNNSQSFAIQFANDPRIDRLQGQLFPNVDPVEGTEQLDPGTPEYREAADQYAELQAANRDDLFAPFVEDAGFLKIREIAVAYDFAGLANNLLNTSIPVREFRLRLSGQNLFTFSPYSYPDPQVSSTGSRGIATNQDFLTLQTPRSFTATLSVGF